MVRGLLAAALVGSTVAERSFVPLFAWSDQPFLSAQVPDVASVDELGNTIGGILSKETRPEVVVAVIYDKLGSTTAFRANGAYGERDPSLAGSAMSEMEATLNAASSSLSVPYLFVNEQSSVSSTLQNLFSEANVHIANSCEAAREELTPSVLNNGVPDLVLLSIARQPGLSEECVRTLLSSATNYVALVSADQSDRKIVTEFAQPVAGASKGAARKLMSSESTAALLYIGPQYILPNILLGLFFMFGFIFVVLVGVCALCQIQTPIRFAHSNLKPPKEY